MWVNNRAKSRPSDSQLDRTLEIIDEDALDLSALKHIFSELVFAPIDALINLVKDGTLGGAAGYTAVLTLLNSVPELIARCHGESGENPTVAEWNLKRTKYLYVYGIYKLGLIADVDMNLSFEDYAGFLYKNLRCKIAHAIVSGRVSLFADMNDDFVGVFGYHLKDQEQAITRENISQIANYSCNVPGVYIRMREGVNRYVAQIERGEEKLHLENANTDFMQIPGFTELLARQKGFVRMVETIDEYFPETDLRKRCIRKPCPTNPSPAAPSVRPRPPSILANPIDPRYN